MTFNDLQPGDRFAIDGAYYEAKAKGERIVIAYKLARDVLSYKAACPPMYSRIPDPEDLTGDEYLTDAFSDLRVNKNNATLEELQAEREAAELW